MAWCGWWRSWWHPTLSARHIVAALRPRVEGAFLPRRVVHVESLPRQATGKITAQALREFALRTLAQADRHRAR